MSAAVEFVRLTHPHPKVEKYVTLYARALHATLNGECLKQQAEAALKSPELDAWDTCKPYIQKAARFPTSSAEGLKVHQSAVEMLGMACYTRGVYHSLSLFSLSTYPQQCDLVQFKCVMQVSTESNRSLCPL